MASQLAPTSSFSSASVKSEDATDQKLMELFATYNKSVTTCLLNPVNTSEFSSMKRRYGLPPFDVVLLGGSVEPWTPSTFLEFLEREHNSENFFFYEEVELLKATKQGGKKPTSDLLYLSEQARQNDESWVASIKNTFVQDDAPEAINVSHEQRQTLLGHIETALQNKQVSPEIFKDTQNEVKRLMLQDAWPRFMLRMTTSNVHESERKLRLIHGLVFLALAVLTAGLILGLHGSRYLLFLTLPLYAGFMDGFMVYETGVCPKSAFKNQCLIKKSGNATQLSCPVAKGALKRAARRTILRGAIGVLLLTGITFALSFIIEGIVGQQLYS